MARKQTLQEQGVPIPARLQGPQRRHDVVYNERAGGFEPKRTGASSTPPRRQTTAPARNSRPAPGAGQGNSPTVSLPRLGGSGGTHEPSVAALEAEFLAAILILILLLFANNQASYVGRMMSFIKRGALTCLLFFILAIIAGMGPNAERFAKAFGALIIVGILLTAPVNTVITDVDALIKNDWVGQADVGTSGSADTNAPQKNQSTPTTLTQQGLSNLVHAAIGSPAYNAAAAEIRAFKSGEVWKVPADAVTALEDIGTHSISSVWDKLSSIIGSIGHLF